MCDLVLIESPCDSPQNEMDKTCNGVSQLLKF